MKCSTTGTRLKVLVLAVLLLTLAFLVAVLVLDVTMPDLPEAPATDLCLRFAHKGQAVGEVTCGEESLHSFIKERVRDNYDTLIDDYRNDRGEELKDTISLKSFIKQHNSDLKPVARLTGDHNREDEQDKSNAGKVQRNSSSCGMVPVRKWTNLRDLAYTGGIRRFGVKIKSGRIIVPVAGEYEVYSYIHFREACEDGVPQIDNPNIPITVSIFKFDILDGHDVEMASWSQPHKISQNKYINVYGSFLSTIVKLKAGDELSVKVSNITFLKIPSFNYFGAHLI